jgi:hypothetical protein
MCRTALFVTVQEHSIAYCRCREAIKLFRFLLSPYSLIGTCNNVQNSTSHWPAEMGIRLNLCIILGVHGITDPCLRSGIWSRRITLIPHEPSKIFVDKLSLEPEDSTRQQQNPPLDMILNLESYFYLRLLSRNTQNGLPNTTYQLFCWILVSATHVHFTCPVFSTERVNIAVALLIRIREVLCPNIGFGTEYYNWVYSWFSSVPQVNTWIVLR